MATAIFFDTHAFVKKLTGAGMPEAQAEIIASERAAMIEDRLASKRDLTDLETKLHANLQHEISTVRSDIEILKRDMTIRLGGMLVALAGILLAAIRYLPPHP